MKEKYISLSVHPYLLCLYLILYDIRLIKKLLKQLIFIPSDTVVLLDSSVEIFRYTDVIEYSIQKTVPAVLCRKPR